MRQNLAADAPDQTRGERIRQAQQEFQDKGMVVQRREQAIVQRIQSWVEVALHGGRGDVLRPTAHYCGVTVIPMIAEEIWRAISPAITGEQAEEENIEGRPTESSD